MRTKSARGFSILELLIAGVIGLTAFIGAMRLIGLLNKGAVSAEFAANSQTEMQNILNDVRRQFGFRVSFQYQPSAIFSGVIDPNTCGSPDAATCSDLIIRETNQDSTLRRVEYHTTCVPADTLSASWSPNAIDPAIDLDKCPSGNKPVLTKTTYLNDSNVAPSSVQTFPITNLATSICFKPIFCGSPTLSPPKVSQVVVQASTLYRSLGSQTKIIKNSYVLSTTDQTTGVSIIPPSTN